MQELDYFCPFHNMVKKKKEVAYQESILEPK